MIRIFDPLDGTQLASCDTPEEFAAIRATLEAFLARRADPEAPPAPGSPSWADLVAFERELNADAAGERAAFTVAECLGRSGYTSLAVVHVAGEGRLVVGVPIGVAAAEGVPVDEIAERVAGALFSASVRSRREGAP